jgi:hypothetical protein
MDLPAAAEVEEDHFPAQRPVGLERAVKAMQVVQTVTQLPMVLRLLLAEVAAHRRLEMHQQQLVPEARAVMAHPAALVAAPSRGREVEVEVSTTQEAPAAPAAQAAVVLGLLLMPAPETEIQTKAPAAGARALMAPAALAARAS